MQKLLRSILGVTFLSTAALSAQCNDCSDWNPCCFQYGLNPPPTCPTWDCCNWIAGLDYIYWKPYVENMHAGQVLKARDYSVDTGFTEGLLQNKPKDFRYEWESGFRITLGYNLPCDKWGFETVWTHFKTDVKSKLVGSGTFSGPQEIEVVCMPAPYFVTGDYLRPFLWANTGTLDSKWHFQINQLDFNFFRDFYVGCSVMIRPYAGLRLAILQNSVTACGSWIISEESGLPIDSVSGTQKVKSDFKGLGLKGGLETHWILCNGLNFYGNFGLAAIYTCVESDNQLTVITDTDGSGPISKLRNEIPYNFETLKVMTDFSLGVEWREPFNCNQNMFAFKFGWEHHVIFSGSDFKSLDNDMMFAENGLVPAGTRFLNSDGNILFYGFVFSGLISF